VSIHAAAARHNRALLATKAQEDVREYNRILSDPDLMPEARAKRAAPIRDRIQARYEALREKTATLVAGAHREYLTVQPRTQRMAAVLKDPMRAFALRELYGDASAGELLLLAEAANRDSSAPDLVLGFAVEAIVARRLTDLSENDRRQIAAAANAALTPVTQRALADYVVAQAELRRLEFDHATMVNEDHDYLARLTAARSVYEVDAGDGSRRILTEREFESLYETAGVSMANPAEWGDLLPLSHPKTDATPGFATAAA
jgi:hypothetical protein